MIDGMLWVGRAGRSETPARWGILAVVGKRKRVAESGETREGRKQGGKVAIFSSRDSNTGQVLSAPVSGQGANITGNPMPLQPVGNFFSGLKVWHTQFLSYTSTQQ